ncbi:DUF2471 domain-containing protein [Paraburkholderia sp. GAS82]|jgi:hypothetical protein|uniref:DUF2471 domain-containing protein n=1 Tax=Paraburkholderia sp. GAS82 TaxID=3035137 RepID=UPI003D230677
MTHATAFDEDVRNIDPIALERALRSASLDLQQVIVTVARRHLNSGRRAYPIGSGLPTWRTLQTIDEQVFENPGFRARNKEHVREMFVRFGDSRLAGSDLDEPVDWRRDDDDLPVVYLTVRALIQSDSTDGGGSD